ncbi:conserved hypothetical protein [Trichormus variabilis ATCC 29413]|uniref:Uncharacterized protein n=2 Tax=Anabaena variabilis TaxID=264691 RepID=Q3MB83_TRIV2|nr:MULTISPECIES: hypothetical protein [Nostocaceae]ABA21753.1 conserved hypothetical protein [Trichormus variabilis ATCC 29413]MBC1217610.1 hypothetical protein [Trichormus variabilis ARAD]MBC1256707.1 hypothetical protein [Trichormus variabilis V5]MBC1268909.1 hypothetical protein [Trichormus variabilis FSR]MBC1304643.1 hypothetical protein [Trichormus variabilis N2B]
MVKNKILICTALALSSGFLGGNIGSQITLMLHSQRCQNQNWGIKELCNVWITPGATWQGATTGVWTGAILGAFAGGLVIRQNRS